VRAATLGAYAHQDLPFEKLVEELRPQRSLGHSPLFQAMLVLQNTPPATLVLREAEAHPLAVAGEMIEFDLTLSLTEKAEGLRASLAYNTDLFDAGTIERMLGHYQVLLEAVAAEPDRRLADLPLLTEAEQHQLLVEWNSTRTGHAQERCLHHLFEEQAERTPDAVAVVFEEEQLTYRELNQRANQLTHHLRGLGVGPETLVGLCVERSLEMVVGLLGILKAGAAYMPLDAEHPRKRIAYQIEDARLRLVLTQQRLRDIFPAGQLTVLSLDDLSAWPAAKSEMPPESGEGAGNLAYVLYTSGSTGRPKGVMTEHRAVVNHLLWMQQAFPLGEADRIVQKYPLGFDPSILEIFGTLLAGARFILARPGGHFDPTYLAGLIQMQGITLLDVVPTLLEALLDQPAFRQGRSLRRVFCGGDSLPPALQQRVHAALPGVELVNFYGPTEATISSTYWICRQSDQRPVVPIGRPAGNAQVFVLDRRMNAVPIGVPGELYIGGAGLARGYLNQAGLTAERFVPSPFGQPGERLYRTGDQARWSPDGNLEYLGRADHQVKLRGYRIELGEIEAALGRHPQVTQAVAVVREDVPGDRRLTAYVAAKDGVKPEAQSLREFLRQELPKYMVPATFVPMEAFPLTSSGKIDRRALPAPEHCGAAPALPRVAPRNEVETRLAEIWGEVLGRERVGVQDNFFDLGGHSLVAVQLVARIEKTFGQSVPLAALFQGPTIEHMAALLGERSRPGLPKQVVALQPRGSRPPLFLLPSLFGDLVHYGELVRHLGCDQPVYGLLPRADDGTMPEYSRLEDMAEQMLRGLRAFRPKGPYCLAGYSFGGPLAYELAQQLTATAQRVALLAFIDSGLPSDTPPALLDVFLSLPRMLANLPYWIRDDLFQSRPGDQLTRLRKKLRAEWQKLWGTLGRGGPSGAYIALNELFDLERFGEHLQSRLELNYGAGCRYKPRVYPGRVTVLQARARRLWQVTRRGPGLSGLATGGVVVRIVPGNHDSILKEPHVRVLARRLQESLDECGAHEA
jgi:aspartate racemase